MLYFLLLYNNFLLNLKPNIQIDSPVHGEHNGANSISVNYCICKLLLYHYTCAIFITVQNMQIYKLIPAAFSLIS